MARVERDGLHLDRDRVLAALAALPEEEDAALQARRDELHRATSGSG